MREIFDKVGMLEIYNLLTECSTVRLWPEPHNLKCKEWKNDVMQYPKLRTFKPLKRPFA